MRWLRRLRRLNGASLRLFHPGLLVHMRLKLRTGWLDRTSLRLFHPGLLVHARLKLGMEWLDRTSLRLFHPGLLVHARLKLGMGWLVEPLGRMLECWRLRLRSRTGLLHRMRLR
jgi:hypothetical protein